MLHLEARRWRLARESAARMLSAFLRHERQAVLRRWRRELRAAALDPSDFDATLAPLCDELPRILDESDDPARVLGERLAGRGAARFRDQARLRDAEREVGLLEPAIVRTWGERHGDLPVEVALLLDSMVNEAVVRISRDYARASEAAEAQLRLVTVMRALQRLSEVVLVLDRRGAVAMAAGPVEALLGRRPRELVGQPGREPGLQALRDGREVPPERVRVRNQATGEERTCEARAFPLREGEQLVGAVELLRDVTLELQRDEELRRADRELGALHARLLRRAHAQAMAELATATASALNNELNAVSMSLSLLHKELPAPSETVARHLYAVEQAVQRAAVLLAHLQQLAARQPNAPPRPVALDQVLMEALDLVRPELSTTSGRRAVRIDARLGEVRPVLAQAGELRELLCTLLIDARGAMPHGGVLQVSTRQERDGGSLALTHALDGAAEGDLLSGTSERGVTLAAARDRARRWGGDLGVETRGRRVTVRLWLPEARAAAAAVTRAPQRPGRRILVVDDDAGNRETLSELLGLSGHEVQAADSGRAALEAVRAAERPFDVALVDLVMPDLSGVELAERLRALDPRLRVALVTGWEPSAIEPQGEPGLIDAIFRKPIDLPAILRFLENGALPAAVAPSPPPAA